MLIATKSSCQARVNVAPPGLVGYRRGMAKWSTLEGKGQRTTAPANYANRTASHVCSHLPPCKLSATRATRPKSRIFLSYIAVPDRLDDRPVLRFRVSRFPPASRPLHAHAT